MKTIQLNIMSEFLPLYILPQKGLNSFYFGSSNNLAESYFGPPEAIEELDDLDFCKSIVWHYYGMGFSLIFDELQGGNFKGVEITNQTTTIANQEIFQLSIIQADAFFRSLGFKEIETENMAFGEKRCSIEDAGIDLYYEKEKLISLYCSLD